MVMAMVQTLKGYTPPLVMTKFLILITVRHRGMGTGISEASKRVPMLSFATQGGK